MEKRRLGKTGLSVTALGFGAMELRHIGKQEADRLLNTVLDSEINYIDTSPDYGPSEEYIGEAISHRRKEFYLATKCGCNAEGKTPLDSWGHIYNRKTLLSNVETSLRLLKTDYIDVWQLHNPLPENLEGGKEGEVINTMLELKKQGKVRFIGISLRQGHPSEKEYPDGHGFRCLREYMKWNLFDVIQIVYGAMARKSELAIGQAAEKGIGIVDRGVVRKYQDHYWQLFEKAKLDMLCEKNESRNSFLLRFALSHPGISTVIMGTKSPEHLQENIQAAAKGKLSSNIYQEAKRCLDAVGIVPEAI